VAEETKSVYSDGQLLELTDTEYAILLLLLKKPNVDGDIYGTSGVNIIVKMVIMER